MSTYLAYICVASWHLRMLVLIYEQPWKQVAYVELYHQWIYERFAWYDSLYFLYDCKERKSKDKNLIKIMKFKSLLKEELETWLKFFSLEETFFKRFYQFIIIRTLLTN